MASPATGMISVRYENPSTGVVRSKSMVLPIIDSISVDYTAQLSEMNTIVYGVRNRFIMDLGVSRKYTVKVVRVNPKDYDDDSLDESRWSNGKWYGEFRDMFDVWQNFCLGSGTKGDKAGGYTFTFTPGDGMSDCIDELKDVNVFIAGTISQSISSGGQKMTISLPLQVARMSGESREPTQLTLTMNTSSESGQRFSFVQKFPYGAQIAIPTPLDSWLNLYTNKVYSHWKTSGGVDYWPGEVITIQSNMVLEAQWTDPLDTHVFTTDDSYTVPEGATRVMVLAVGGGGGGGSGLGFSLITQFYFAGAGGGAGEFVQKYIEVQPGSTISVSIGAGGAGRDLKTSSEFAEDGGRGGDTIVTYMDHTLVTAHGGYGGGARRGSFVGANPEGGQMYYAGGSPGNPKGEDGQTASPNTTANVGKGCEAPTGDMGSGTGGGGGGASALNHYIGGVLYSSIGGDGGTIGVDPTSGQYGGGGGGSTSSASGASGFVGLIFYSSER